MVGKPTSPAVAGNTAPPIQAPYPTRFTGRAGIPASLHPLVLAGSLSGVGAGFAMTLGGVAGRCGDMCRKRYTEQLVAAAPERWGRSTWRRQTGLLVLDVAHGAAAYRREWPASLLRDERY